MANKGKGFVLDCGDPQTAKIAILLEAPGREELAFTLKPEKGRRFYETQTECNTEREIRERAYPTLERRFITKGVGVVGRSGFELAQWCLPAAGLRRSDIFIANTLRCLPPKQGDSHYPQGGERKIAEACCRYYDRWGVGGFGPDVSIVSIHPAAVVREPTLLYLQVKNFEKARDFVKSGFRTLVLSGGKAVKWWLGYGENVIRWQGTYEYETATSRLRRKERLERYGETPLGGKHEKAKNHTRPGTHATRGRGPTAIESILGIL